MSICVRCQVREERPCSYAPRTREAYRVLIAALRCVAERHGYALAVHGSLKTDIDLLAAPWREGATSAASVAEAIRATAEQVWGHAEVRERDRARSPEPKPCGRLAWAFYLQPGRVEGPYIDLSVMPTIRAERAAVEALAPEARDAAPTIRAARAGEA